MTSSFDDDVSSTELNIPMDSIAINVDGPTNNGDLPQHSSLIHFKTLLADRLRTLEPRDLTQLPRYTLKQRKVSQALTSRLYDLMHILDTLRNIRFDTRTSPHLEARWHEPITEDKLSSVGHSTYASLEAEISQNIGQGLSCPNHWQFHLARVIKVRKTINDIIKVSNELVTHFDYLLGIHGFTLKQHLDLSNITHSFHSLLHQFEVDYFCVLLFFLSDAGFTHQY
jgi:hypothetical protein